MFNDEQREALIDNVVNRGMGFMSIHCTVLWAFNDNIRKLFGVRSFIHGPIQPVRLHNFNQNHPITRGMEDCALPLDENFGMAVEDQSIALLFESNRYRRQEARHRRVGCRARQGAGVRDASGTHGHRLSAPDVRGIILARGALGDEP